jgi:hypothetical protein
MTEVVFFLQPDSAVREEHERAVTGKTLHRMIGVDPGIDTRRGFQLGPGRPQLRRDDVSRSERVEKIRHPNPQVY